MKTVEEQNEELRRFVKKVADWDDLRWFWANLQDEAIELIVLYGDPDGVKPQGILQADFDPVWRVG